MIDMDGFKQLNDSCGHQVGDQLLVMAGKVISANMRRMDVAARYGGDEFVLLLPHASEQDAAQAAQRIREEYRAASAALLKREKGMTMSIGIGSLSRNKPTGADELIAMADAALYQAKERGRDRIVATTDIACPVRVPAQPVVQ
jgi:diguanylate cyclase (GGDEF)-like protein